MEQNSERSIVRTLLIDADDTLWENNIFYLRCLAQFREHMEVLGCSPDDAEEMLQRTELETIPEYGYGPQGYITALGLACERLLGEAGRERDETAVEAARRIGEAIVDPPMVLIADVEQTLRTLRPTSRLVLVTKGDEETQGAKIERSGLGPLFDAQFILPEKDPKAYREVVAELGSSPQETWMVGNSPKSDINPACKAGLGAIFIPHNHTWVAEVEEIDCPEGVVTLHCFSDLPAFFGIQEAPGA
jgi:putative hydrolase of the HAD superfamily